MLPSSSLFSLSLLLLAALLLTQAVALSPFLSLRSASLEPQPHITVLAPNVPVVGSVQSGAYAYYAFTLPSPARSVSIISTPSTDDADLFVSDRLPLPSVANHNFSSHSVGVDEVLITHAAARTYYIAVFGFTNATFTLQANASVDSTRTPPTTPLKSKARRGK